MKRAAQEQLLVMVKQLVEENVPDLQVRRLAKGLSKALARWLRMAQPNSDHARSGTPRPMGLASVNASVASSQEHNSGESTRP
jgi:hypothetical protein